MSKVKVSGLQPEVKYPKYFGYNPKTGGISELSSDSNELGEIPTKISKVECSVGK
ncbi:MAG: hypothetical protein NT096_16965 [Proteobacteria bacterium]|nr:hypothetical protein [Pseudomonadota bacterium]